MSLFSTPNFCNPTKPTKLQPIPSSPSPRPSEQTSSRPSPLHSHDGAPAPPASGLSEARTPNLYCVKDWDAERAARLASGGSYGAPVSAPKANMAAGQQQQSGGDVISELYHHCNKRGIKPDFSFIELEPQRFAAQVSLARPEEQEGTAQVVSGDAQTFLTKREAKEACALRGLEIVKSYPEPSRRKRGGGAGAQQNSFSSSAAAAHDADPGVASAEDEENYQGSLQEFLQKRYLPLPQFAITEVAPGQFKGTCSFTLPPPHCANRPVTFGDDPADRTSFPNKKAARSAAARTSVRWLREEGLWTASGAGSGPPRKKTRASAATEPDGSTAHSAADAVTSPKTAPAPTAPGNPAGTQQDPPAGRDRTDPSPSLPAQVASLAHSLGLQAPTYHLHPNPDKPALWSGGAQFADFSPGGARFVDFHTGGSGATERVHGELVGAVKEVHGKRKTRDEVARRVVKLLVEERERRLGVLGVAGGSGGGGGGLGSGLEEVGKMGIDG